VEGQGNPARELARRIGTGRARIGAWIDGRETYRIVAGVKRKLHDSGVLMTRRRTKRSG